MQHPPKRGWTQQHKILLYECMFVRCVRKTLVTKHFLHTAPYNLHPLLSTWTLAITNLCRQITTQFTSIYTSPLVYLILRQDIARVINSSIKIIAFQHQHEPRPARGHDRVWHFSHCWQKRVNWVKAGPWRWHQKKERTWIFLFVSEMSQWVPFIQIQFTSNEKTPTRNNKRLYTYRIKDPVNSSFVSIGSVYASRLLQEILFPRCIRIQLHVDWNSIIP